MTVDTDKDTIVVHDGATAGGYELARADVSNVVNPQFGGTGSLLLPDGSTAQRPSGSNGMVRYNTSENYVEGYQNGAWMPLGQVVASSYAEFTTQVTLSGATSGTILSGTHTKQYGASVTDLYLFANGVGVDPESGHCGMYVAYGGTTSYEFFDYQYSSWAAAHIFCQGFAKFTGKAAGAQSYSMGWNSVVAGAERPAAYWNPNAGTTDSRRRKGATNFIFLEVLV